MNELTSRELRDGQPLACAYDCHEIDGGVRVGLLFVWDRSPRVLTFLDPETGAEYRLTLPDGFDNLPEETWAPNAILGTV